MKQYSKKFIKDNIRNGEAIALAEIEPNEFKYDLIIVKRDSVDYEAEKMLYLKGVINTYRTRNCFYKQAYDLYDAALPREFVNIPSRENYISELFLTTNILKEDYFDFENFMENLQENVKQTAKARIRKDMALLLLKGDKPIDLFDMTAAQYALLHYVLQKAKIEPRFIEKVKEIELVSKKYSIGSKNFQMKYNVISKDGNDGFSIKDYDVVEKIIQEHHPKALPSFKKHIKNPN